MKKNDNAGPEPVADNVVTTQRFAALQHELEARGRMQTVVAELGQAALTGIDESTLAAQVCALVAEALDLDYARVLEPLGSDRTRLVMSASIGIRGPVDRDGVDTESLYTIRSTEPTVFEELAAETRFDGRPTLTRLGVVSGISVVLPGRSGAIGVLGGYTTRARRFRAYEVEFVRSLANVLAAAMENKRTRDALALRGTARAKSGRPDPDARGLLRAAAERIAPAVELLTSKLADRYDAVVLSRESLRSARAAVWELSLLTRRFRALACGATRQIQAPLDEVIDHAILRARRGASRRNVRIDACLQDTPAMLMDEARLTDAFDHLLLLFVSRAAEDASVRVALYVDGFDAAAVVTIGVSAEIFSAGELAAAGGTLPAALDDASLTLAIAKQTVGEHGGTLVIDQCPRSTAVTIHLPLGTASR